MSKRAKASSESVLIKPPESPFKTPSKKDQPKPCPTMADTPVTTPSEKDSQPTLAHVIDRLTVIQECIDCLASVILTQEDSHKDMDDEE